MTPAQLAQISTHLEQITGMDSIPTIERVYQQRGAQVRSTCRVIAERAYPCPTIRALDGEVTDG